MRNDRDIHDNGEQRSRKGNLRNTTAFEMEWNDTMRPCVSFLPIYNGFLDILEFKEIELHMVGGNSKEDCQANNLAVCDWLADKLARHGFVGQSH